MVAAIQTRYAGYHFRSRLEARWAVFLDHLGVEWLYEPEGYSLPSGPYLPDFLIHPHTPCQFWLEIKPDLPNSGPTPREVRLVGELADATQVRAYMYCRQPGSPVPLTAEWATQYVRRWTEDSRSGRVPGIDPSYWWDSGLQYTGFWSYPNSRPAICDLWWTDCPHCGQVLLTCEGAVSGCPQLVGGWQPRHSAGHADTIARVTTPRLLAAYEAARSARFEHGETPR